MGRNKRPMKSLDLPGTSTKNTRLKEEYDLAYYVHDRVELMHKVFSILSPKELKAIAPSSCSKLTVTELQEICLEELLGISSKRVCAVLDGVEPPSNSESSESDSSDDDDDEVSTDRNRNHTARVTETVCLDTESEDESVALPSRSKHKKSNKKSKTNNGDTVISDSDRHKRAAERAGVTVLELLELQARARAIRAQLQAQGNKKDNSNTMQSSEETQDKSQSHAEEDDVEELIEVKEEMAVIEISSDEERVKIEHQKEEPTTNNRKSQEKTIETENVTNGPEKQTPKNINKDSDSVNTNKDTDKAANTNKNIENAKEKHKKSKSKTSKKKKSKDKEKSPLKLSPIKDSIYENKNEMENQEENDKEKQNTENDDVILINDDDDFTVEKNAHPENTAESNSKVIVRKIQLDRENVVISVPNIANSNCKIVTETTNRLNSTVSKVERIIEKKKLNSTVCKVTDKKGEKRKKNVKKVVRRDSDDGINLELSDDEKLEMEYLCGDKVVVTDGNRSGSDDSDGITVVLNHDVSPTTIKEKNTLDVSENYARIEINDEDSDTNDRVVNDAVGTNNSIADVIEHSILFDTDNNIDENLDRNKVSNTNVSNTNTNCSDTVEDDSDTNKNYSKSIENDTDTKKTDTSTLNTDYIEAVSNKNINISEIDTIKVSCIEDIPLMPEGPQLPSELEKYQNDLCEETPNYNKESDKTDSPSEDSEPDSESESSSDNSGKSSDVNGKSSDVNRKSSDVNGKSSDVNRKSSDVNEKSNDKNESVSKECEDGINKETCDVSCKENDKKLNVNDDKVDETKSEQESRKKQTNRDLSEGEITDSSTDIEVMDLKPDVVCISGSDDDKPLAKKIKKLKKRKKDVHNKVLNTTQSIEDENIEKVKTKEIITILESVKETTDTKEVIKTINLDEEEVMLELSDDSSCYEVEGVNILSKEPTAEEIEALSAKIDDFERQDVVTNEEIQQHEAKNDENLPKQELESLANVSWKDRYLDSKKVKVVISTANIFNALRKKNIELKKKIEAAKKVAREEVENLTRKEVERTEVEIGSIEHYNMLQGSTKYVDPVKRPEIKINDAGVIDKDTETDTDKTIEVDTDKNIELCTDKQVEVGIDSNMEVATDKNITASSMGEPETNLTKEMKKDAKLLLKMYKRLLKYNDMNKVKAKNPNKKKKKKLKKSKLNET